MEKKRGAIAAYSALAGIPLVGPGLGIAAAAALTAFGIESAGKVTAAEHGGFIQGFGGVDSQRAVLTPGEFVVKRSAAQKNISLLHALNNGQSFAHGGRVDRRIGRIPNTRQANRLGRINNVIDSEFAGIGLPGIRSYTGTKQEKVAAIKVALRKAITDGSPRGQVERAARRIQKLLDNSLQLGFRDIETQDENRILCL